jgi:hypothetical protein
MRSEEIAREIREEIREEPRAKTLHREERRKSE